ncbi:MAG: tRNA pseudouridine(38-40) synthase TruA [Verrucomicrobiales bacterium]
MPNIKFTIAYDGAPWLGWQSQKTGGGIQNEIARALSITVEQEVRVFGAGRTDRGVHALGQVAHSLLPDEIPSLEKLRDALNSRLPGTIRILRAQKVSPAFHSRYSSCGKHYRYEIINAPVLNPLLLNRAWHIQQPLDMEAMQKALACFVGEHDFSMFCGRLPKAGENIIRNLSRCQLGLKQKKIVIDFEGSGFLYRMVRLMVGAIVRCGRGKTLWTEVQSFLAGGRHMALEQAGSRPQYCAPPDGLYLVKVRY